MEDPYSAHQPDEGYSEDPLNPSIVPAPFAVKARLDAASPIIDSQVGGELPAWFLRQVSTMDINTKRGSSASGP
jgi:hypothetical protein